MAISQVDEVGAMVHTDWQVATAAHYYSIGQDLNMTTLPLCHVYLECVLSL